MTGEGIEISRRAPISTWFGVGGGADALATPLSVEGLVRVLDEAGGGAVRVLGDGANLLVEDGGVDGVVIDTRRLDTVEIDAASGLVRVGAGARLPQLINETARAGLAGLEILAGIPASVGGAVVMNAGGRFGEIGGVVRAVEGVDRCGGFARLERGSIGFGYRRSGLEELIVTAVEFGLAPDDPAAVRGRLKECMAYKKSTQPMSASSAGCCFKNPTLEADLDGVGERGARVSAGLLIDRAGGKGLAVGGAVVSEEHANFIVTRPGATAADVIGVMERVASLVLDRFGVGLEREVVVWGRGS